jgi:colicin import membrane protein
MAIFFAITMKMTKSIKELDTMVYAMAKRVIEVDASLTAIGKTNSDFSEINEKQEEVITTQTQVAKRLDELGKSLAAMPTVVATEANKSSDLKFKDMQKQLTTLESKLQSFDGKLQSVAEKASSRMPPPAPAAPQGPSTQVLLTEIQKIKSDLNAAVQVRERTQTAAEAAAIKNIEKTIDKAAVAAGDAQKAADKAAQSAKAATDAQRAAAEAQKAAAASERASAAERLAQQKAAAERAAAMRMQPEKPVKSAEQIAEEKAAAERAGALRAAKAAAEKAAADKAAAAADRAAAEKARAAAAASVPPVVREKPIQYPRVPD